MPQSQPRTAMVAGLGALALLLSLLAPAPAAIAARAVPAMATRASAATAVRVPGATTARAPVATAAAGSKSRSRSVTASSAGRLTTPTGVIPVTGAPLAGLVVSSGDLAFVSNTTRNEVEVVNLHNGALEQPIAVGSLPKGLDLSPDGSTLYVADSGGEQVSVVNVATRLETHRITIPAGTDNDTPFSIAVANNGKAFLTTTFAGSGFGARMLEINLSTEAVKARGDFYLGSTTEDTHLVASADRSHIGVVAGDISSGPVFLYTAATDTFTPEHDLNTFVDTIALDRTGSELLVGPGSYLLDASLTLEGTIPGRGLGMAIAASGTIGYRVQNADVEVIDLVRQRVVSTIPLPEGVGSAPGSIAVSTDGATLAVLTTTGVSLVAVAGAQPVPSCSSTVTGTPTSGEVAHVCGAPLADVVVDGAGHAFASNPSRNEVDVVDLATGALEAPITVGSEPLGLDLSPDGSTLYVADSGGNQVSVVDVATRTETRRITVPPASFFADTPFSIAVANNGKAFLSTTFAGSGFGARVLEINLSTGALRQRTDFFIRGTTTEDTHLASSGDHSHLAAVAGDISSGPVFGYTAATDTFTPEHDLNAFVDIVAVDHTGSQVLVDPGSYLFDGALNLVGTIPGGGLGVAMSPSGTTAYRVQNGDVEVIDLTRQLVVRTIALPEAVGRASGGVVVSPDGTTLAVLTAGGISLVPTSGTPQATTTLTATASGPGQVGAPITDAAVLSGGVAPTGTITFRLFGPNDTTSCTGPAAFTSTKPVNGNGRYVSAPFTPTSAGTYHWVASYSGDGANKPAGSGACSNPAQTVTVSAAHTTLTVTASATSGSFPLTVGYTYAEANDGADPISGVAVRDSGCSPVAFATGAGGPGGTLQPGTTWTFTCTRTFTQPGAFSDLATATGTDVANGIPAPSESGTATVTVGCDRVITTSVQGTLTAGPGATCIVGTTVNGGLDVPVGSAVFVAEATIGGPVSAEGATAFTLCGSAVVGDVAVSASTGLVTIGNPRDNGCAGNVITGTVTSAANQASLRMFANHVGGNLSLVSTGGATPAQIGGNQIDGTISCGGNAPTPTDGGSANSEGGRTPGQCSVPGL